MAERQQRLDDRQLDALLERLDRLCDEVHTLNRRTDSADALVRIAHELSTLNESLQALAYAALGPQGPQIRRRRSASPVYEEGSTTPLTRTPVPERQEARYGRGAISRQERRRSASVVARLPRIVPIP